jgi:hypothetical protein
MINNVNKRDYYSETWKLRSRRQGTRLVAMLPGYAEVGQGEKLWDIMLGIWEGRLTERQIALGKPSC